MDNLMCLSLRKLRVCLKIWNPTLTGFIKKCIGPSPPQKKNMLKHMILIHYYAFITGWWFQPPLKNLSQWEGLSHILWKIIQMLETTNQFIITYPYQFSDCYTFKPNIGIVLVATPDDHKHTSERHSRQR